ncbi:hypothetical protein [Paraburkholderia megapolitana]|uniref:Uncharacterized protein n=1 Tax=Paraburkholderia megapolitana TaxID=420953 RepID=A0A1I3W2R8_9BURK|nr:hypothetical protein [Paraburkholderia megapolitana]QDQ82208.1 hypothetical protein FNZ07_12975 [Paraburkholderia megapolitana]SFK00937.1 hypothetical protein SAMN05192543_11577 [Paraburkholderia megapolitana]
MRKAFAKVVVIALPVLIISTPLRVSAGLFEPDDYSGCILEKMPGVQNDLSAGAIANECNQRFPNWKEAHRRSGFFAAYHSGSACFAEKSRATGSEMAARLIYFACHNLYDPAAFDPESAQPVQ